MTIRLFLIAASAAAVAFAAPALARHETTTTTTTTSDRDGHVERVIVLTDHREHGPDGARAGDDGRWLRVFRTGGADVVQCNRDHPVVDRSSRDGHDRTRVVICDRGGELSAADRTARLERALERIQHMDGLPDSSKAQVTAALREAIEEARNAR